jgi:hypothetical protein
MVDEGDVTSQRHKVKGLFNGTVAAANDGDVTSGELRAVAFRAGAYTPAQEAAFAGDVEGSGGRSHGKNQGTAVVLAIAHADRLGLVPEIDSVDVAGP